MVFLEDVGYWWMLKLGLKYYFKVGKFLLRWDDMWCFNFLSGNDFELDYKEFFVCFVKLLL